MSLINPFAGLRPASEFTEEVIAPPYDVVSRIEAYDIAHYRPWNFLHISKPEIDLGFDIDEYDPRVYVKGMENYQRMVKEGILRQDPTPCYYVYRLTIDDHQQTGLMAAVSIDAYNNGRIHKHEHTRPEKEKDRVKHMMTINAQTSPVMLTHKHQDNITELLTSLTLNPATVNVIDDADVRHELWVLNDASLINDISQIYNQVTDLYIADGHHRTAATSVVAENRVKTLKHHHGTHNYLLAAIFPASQLNILSYNRLVTDFPFLSPEQFLEQLATVVEINESFDRVYPQKPGDLGMYFEEQWFHLTFRPEFIPTENLSDKLDVSLLDNLIFKQILGIQDSRSDHRICYVGGGARSLEELEECVDSGEAIMSFSLYPTQMNDLLTIADANKIMPAKSTWFDPKLADGLVCLTLDNS